MEIKLITPTVFERQKYGISSIVNKRIRGRFSCATFVLAYNSEFP